ncbi:MAG: tetratricopeptide repeat protein [Rhodobacteraceae bacterium]|nr:tetratricopeptide repeat protein [Paracoccaceae bacterium]
MRPTFLFPLLVAMATTASAKPLISDSESSLAIICINYRDTDERIVEICSRALAEAPGASPRQIRQMRKSLGDAFNALGETERARVEYETILRQSPDATAGHLGLGWLLLADDPAAAARHFDRAARTGVSAEVVGGRAKAMYKAGEIGFDDLVEMLDAAIAIDPEYSWAVREKGWQLIDLNREEEAIEAFTTALGIHPEDANALFGLAKARLYSAPELALGDVNRALQIESDDFWGLDLRSQIMFNLERYRQSIRDAERVIALEPDYADGFVRKARALAELGERQTALDLLEKLAERENFTSNGYLRYWRASLMADEQDWRGAKRVLQVGFDAGEGDQYDHRLMAYILIEQGRTGQAMRHIETALKAAPDWALLHFYRSKVLALKRQPAKAFEAFAVVHGLGVEGWMVGEFAAALVKRGYFVEAIRARLQFRSF